MAGFFNLFLGKKVKVEKVNVSAIANTMIERKWNAEIRDDKTILVNERYYNKQRTQDKLYLSFEGGKVKFNDSRGYMISEVPMSALYTEMKDICSVL